MIIRIKNLRLRTILGVNPGERETLQDVVINVEIEVDGQKAVQTDSLAHTVNYRDLTKRIIDKVEHFSGYLLETLADQILKLVMEDTRIKRAVVEVDKPYALRFADSVSVRCEARQPL